MVQLIVTSKELWKHYSLVSPIPLMSWGPSIDEMSSGWLVHNKRSTEVILVLFHQVPYDRHCLETDFHHFLCTQTRPLSPLHFQNWSVVHTLSPICCGHASTSKPDFVRSNFSRRPRNIHKHDHLGMCARVGHGMATFAWALWWIDNVLTLTTGSHLTFVMYIFKNTHCAEKSDGARPGFAKS